uniref:Ig-like domain-containing protein n=1 Tax=Sinocyclocheilus grahami TaxID=75366 RepID=A0A672N7Z2_SINGR
HSVGQSSSDSQKLLCSATGFDPKIKWLSKSKEKTGRALDATMMEDGRVKVYREILVPQQEWNEGVSYTCQTDNRHSGKTAEKSTSIYGDLSGLQNTNLLCLITGFFPSDISVQWHLNETQLDASQFTNSPVVAHTSGGFAMHSALTLPASEWKDGMFSCVVSHESSQSPIIVTLVKCVGFLDSFCFFFFLASFN